VNQIVSAANQIVSCAAVDPVFHDAERIDGDDVR
jgi:hypothetical protein